MTNHNRAGFSDNLQFVSLTSNLAASVLNHPEFQSKRSPDSVLVFKYPAVCVICGFTFDVCMVRTTYKLLGKQRYNLQYQMLINPCSRVKQTYNSYGRVKKSYKQKWGGGIYIFLLLQWTFFLSKMFDAKMGIKIKFPVALL